MKQAELFTGLLAGDQHTGGIRCLALFGVADSRFEALCRDVDRYRHEHPSSLVGDEAHVTHWTKPEGRVEQYSLLNRSGRSDDFRDDHDLSCRGKWFFDTDTFPELGRWIADWPHPINFRVNVLGPGAALGAHEEHVPFRTEAGTVGARLRFHLPTHTNDDAELQLEGRVYRLEPGVVYLVNQGCVHSAHNGGADPRVHLVWDALLTADLFAFLFENRRVPASLRALSDREVAPRRDVAPAAYRRLAPRVSATEAADLALCLPQ